MLSGRRDEAAWDDSLGEKPAQADFYDLKGVVEGLAADLHLPGVTFEPARDVPHLHPGRAAQLLVSGKSVGAFGELHPTVAASFKLADRAVLVAELDLEAVLAAVPERFPYRPVSIFPPVLRDVAAVVAEDVPAERVLAELTAAGGDLLEGARLFDVYRGESIPAGTKSLAYALTYRVADRQLVRQGSGQGPPEDRGPAAARPQGPDPGEGRSVNPSDNSLVTTMMSVLR